MDPTHWNEQYSKENIIWDISFNGYVGGHFPIPNLSGGYHGILKQWWDKYNTGTSVLLVSENNNIKKEFEKVYPTFEFETIDFFPELIHAEKKDCDIFADICKPDVLPINKYSLVINQATLEHVYNPFGAMHNIFKSLQINGVCVLHTHPLVMPYHSYPRDYIRFMKDWWYDLPKHIAGIELVEFLMVENLHVFTCYKKISEVHPR